MPISVILFMVSFLGAISGYLRELALAATFGAGRYTDAYFVAASIPLVIGDLLIGSALLASVIPVFSKLNAESTERNHQRLGLFNSLLIVILTVATILAVTAFLLMPTIIRYLAPGFDAETNALAVHYGKALIWLLPINGLILFANLVLNASRVFVLPATTWGIVNIFFFVIVPLGHTTFGKDVLTLAALLGPIVMLGVNFWCLSQKGLLRFQAPDFSMPLFQDALRLARPVFLTLGVGSGLGLLMLSHTIIRSYGSVFGEGAVSALGYAFRIYEVPISLMTATAGVLVLPAFANLYHQADKDAIRNNVKELLSWTLPVLLPATILVYFLAEPLVTVLFHRGAFKPEDVLLTAKALQGFAPAVIFETIFMILFRVLYAIHRPHITVILGILSLCTLFCLIELFGPGHTIQELALRLTFSFMVTGGASVFALRYILGKGTLPCSKELAVTIAVSGAAALPIFFLHPYMLSIHPLLAAIVESMVYGLVYLLLAWKFMPRHFTVVWSIVMGFRLFSRSSSR